MEIAVNKFKDHYSIATDYQYDQRNNNIFSSFSCLNDSLKELEELNSKKAIQATDTPAQYQTELKGHKLLRVS